MRESIEILRSVLGEEAKEIHLLGTVLNNLVSTVLQKGNIQEAKDLFLQVIEINENAQDYSSEEERGVDMYRSQLGLKQAEEILRTTSQIQCSKKCRFRGAFYDSGLARKLTFLLTVIRL